MLSLKDMIVRKKKDAVQVPYYLGSVGSQVITGNVYL